MSQITSAEWQVPQVNLPQNPKHPFIACNAQELDRVRAAYAENGRAKKELAKIIDSSEKAVGKPIVFPPRGGQHNQWYQCDACQIALKTIDDTHHQCPKCEKVYTGAPYDDVIFEHVHEANLLTMYNAAWSYAITGEKKFAEVARIVLLGYAERYTTYPFHDSRNVTGIEAIKSGGHLFEQTLNESVALSKKIVPAYDLVFDTLSADDRRAINEKLIRPMLQNIARNRTGKNNWQTWHNAAFMWGGAMLGEAEWVQRALDDPEHGFAFQMNVSVLPEGMWYENSWGYHFYTLMALTTMADGAMRIGIDLYGHPMMKRMYTLPKRYLMPDGLLPRFGDSTETELSRMKMTMAAGAHAYDDPNLKLLVTGEPTIETILYGIDPVKKSDLKVEGSEVFPGTGHVILRTKGDAGLAAVMTFGPFGGFHGHFDKLSFVFYGHGHELGIDPGRAFSQAYRLPIHKNWYRATISHNAVVVDGKSQEGAAGRLEFFKANDQYAAAMASCVEAYPGVEHDRLLLLTPTYLLVVDRLESDVPRQFDWIYHNQGTSVSSTTATAEGKLEQMVGAEYVQRRRQGASDGAIDALFDGTVKTRLTVAGAPGTKAFVGDGPFKSVDDRVPLVIVSRNGTSVNFAAVIEPGLQKVTAVESRSADGNLEVTIHRGGDKDRLILSAAGLRFIVASKQVLVHP